MDFIHALNSQGKKAHAHFGWLLYLGIFNIILGFFAVAFTNFSTLLTVLYLGWLLIFSGLGSLYLAYKFKNIGGHWSLFILGTLAIVCGFLMLFNPHNDAVVITLLAAIFIFTTGWVSILSCFFTQFPHKTWVFFSGLISIFCAYVIYASWPFSGTWVPGTFMGVYLIFHGVTQIQIGSAGRRLFKTSDRAK